ncbi:MAG TPA: hypothetical protein VHW09_17740, partial [Bryobacteraceae bacterium]|nr:hypothetical protein [Bryobacteraceae bacterium]
SRLETRYFVQPKFRWDDRSDDCAFGAMMLLALRQKFRKLRFQMIANTTCHDPLVGRQIRHPLAGGAGSLLASKVGSFLASAEGRTPP